MSWSLRTSPDGGDKFEVSPINTAAEDGETVTVVIMPENHANRIWQKLRKHNRKL
jgi:hypothetical protein